MLSFKNYMKMDEAKVFCTFARMNPPTIGHSKLLDTMHKLSEGSDIKIFLSKSYDSKKNPLLYESKIKHVRKFFPRHARNVVNEKEVNNILEAATFLHNKGYQSLNCVIGEDRYKEFDTLLNKYNDVKHRHGYYNFSEIKVHSAGKRDPMADGVIGTSSSKLRQAAINEDFISFSQNLPVEISNTYAQQLFNEVRVGLNLNEVVNFKAKLKLTENNSRDKYISGDMYNIGDSVIIKESEEIVQVKELGPNYIIVEDSKSKIFKKWLSDVEVHNVR